MVLSPRLLFLSFLGIGLVTGLFVGTLSEAIAAPVAKSVQQNTLFVIVDDLGAEHPALEGIWLAARSEQADAINWVPVYPVPLTEAGEEYAEPHSAFYLPNSDFDDPNTLPPLRSQGAWWDDVFWLDEAAMGVLQSLTGQAVAGLSDPWIEPQRALFEQVQILNTLCKSPGTSASNSALDQILALMPNHLRSSVSPFELITRWDGWEQDSFSLICSHPWAD